MPGEGTISGALILYEVYNASCLPVYSILLVDDLERQIFY